MSIRFGLLGTGPWAELTQAPALARHDDAEFVGVWGRDPAKARRLADRHAVRAYDDVDALIADVDAVAVALPPGVQAELALRAAEAGRHLLLDKPLALTTEAADRVVAAVEARGVASVLFFTNRFYSGVSAFLREAVADGPWDGARATLFASIFQPGNPYGASPWRRDKGGLWDIGPHALSLLLPVLGPVTEVAARTGPRDTTHLLLGHRDGAASTLSVTLDAAPAASMHEVEFHGDRGFATVPRGEGGPVEAFTAAIDQLRDTAAEGRTDHPCDVRFGREVVAILEAAESARRDGRTVRPLPAPPVR
ncbi:MAG: Gfo/Idh/MocA family protein [Actinomadura sp.]